MTIGYKKIGHGPHHVLVLHDWFSDCSSYDACLPYLTVDKFTYVFMDVRGYGQSKHITGQYTLGEITADVLDLVDHLEWNRFHLIGHSMNGLTAQWIALKTPERIKSMVAITPVPACGAKAPPEILPLLIDAAVDNYEGAKGTIHIMSGNRHHDNFINYKVKMWRETSIPEARVAYLHMFSETDFADEIMGLQTPTLVMTGQYDIESHQRSAMEATLLKWLPNSKLIEIENAGHYPMQETPVYFIGQVEGFLEGR